MRIPRTKTSLAGAELFIFLLLLLHGPAAATIAAGGRGRRRLASDVEAMDEPHRQSGAGRIGDVRLRNDVRRCDERGTQ